MGGEGEMKKRGKQKAGEVKRKERGWEGKIKRKWEERRLLKRKEEVEDRGEGGKKEGNVDLYVDIIIIELFEERREWSHRCQALEVK